MNEPMFENPHEEQGEDDDHQVEFAGGRRLLDDERVAVGSDGQYGMAGEPAGGRRTGSWWYVEDPEVFFYRAGESDRPRIGWSLAVASVCQLIIATMAMLTGATTIGVLSTAAVAVGSALLVGAEVAARSKR